MGLFDGFDVDELVNACEKFEQENTGNGDYEDIPDGKYEVFVNNMDFTTSSTGKPMIKYDFMIMKGNYANWHIFINNVIDPDSEHFKWKVSEEKKFLKSMVHDLPDAPIVTEEAILKRNKDFIDEFFDFVCDNYEYLLEKKTNKSKNTGKKYPKYTIKKIYVLD